MRVIVAVLLALSVLGGRWAAAPPAAGKVSAWVSAHTAAGQEAEFLVVLSQQADLSGAAALPTRRARGRYVYETLWQTAQATQDPLLRWLAANDVPHRAYYIVNAIWVKGDAAVAEALAARADVARLEGNPAIANSLHVASSAAATAPNGVESNLSYVKADVVWALGYTGQGIVVGAQDTGYQWDHPAVINQYRGWNGTTADHDYNWHDSIHTNNLDCAGDSPEPCDDHGHGTHTLGTAVGDDGAGNQIGVAPGATWIGCRNMNEGVGTPATYLECFEWFLAPYPVGGGPQDGEPDLAPDVTINSWGCPPSEGCDDVNVLRDAVEAQRAAGIFTVASAGNSGPNCSTVNDPSGIYDAAYTVGALNKGTDTLANFSSRGPVTVDGSGRPKPDLAAPGTSIRSSYLNNTYASLSGTSMAVPHVAGAVALLWSARPALRGDVNATEILLNYAAHDLPASTCGSSGVPNHSFGFGRLDVLAALAGVHFLPMVHAGPIAH